MIDFHTHTYLCEHATGNPEEYVESALAQGITILGFSDHAPLPDGLREGITMHSYQIEEYIGIVERMQNRFDGRIAIRLGFEVDFPFRDSFDRKYLIDPRIDYLIGSCHYLGNWPLDYSEAAHEYASRGIDNVYDSYYDSLLACAASGMFNIIGHFDLAKKFGYRSTKDMTSKIRSVAKAAARTNTAVELNTSGLRKPVNEIYPSETIIRILFEENVPVTLGSDAHAPQEVGADFDKAVALLRKVGYSKISAFEKRKQIILDL
ncbi:MAG TPA: histidinol-phosphatase HisJ [Spirochaetota bacterium]